MSFILTMENTYWMTRLPREEDIFKAINLLRAPKSPSFYILENSSGSYVQAAGGKKRYTIEWRSYDGENFQHFVAGKKTENKDWGQVETHGAHIKVMENEVLQKNDLEIISLAFIAGNSIPDAYSWRDISGEFK